MALTHAQLREYLRSFTGFDLDPILLGEGETELTNPNATRLLNWGIRAVSDYCRCNYDPRNTLTMTSQAGNHLIDCRDSAVVAKKVLQPRVVTLNSSPLRDPNRNVGLWTLQELENLKPGYQTYSNSTPARAVWLPDNQLLLSPPPDATAAAASNNFISGWYLAADLADTDVGQPDIPEELQELIVYFAAYHAALPNASEQEGWLRLRAFNAEWSLLAERYRRTYLNLLSGPRSRRGMNSDAFTDTIWA